MAVQRPALATVVLGTAVTALFAVGAELAIVSSARWHLVASLWELQFGTLWLMPAAFSLLWVLCAAWWGWFQALRSKASWVRWGALVAFAAFGAAVAYGVSNGRHFELWWRRAGFVALAALGGGLVAHAFTPRLARWRERAPRRLAAAAMLLAVSLQVINATVLVRLYEAFHLGLAVLAVGSFTLGVQLLVERSVSRTRSRVAWALGLGPLLIAVLALKPASSRLARFDNFRLLLSDDAPVLGHAVSLAAWLAPPPPLHVEPEAAAVSSSAGVSLAGKDILLVSIDALRADHVGAYGHRRPTTPNIDRLAAEGVRFEWAYCATPHTSYSVTSMMTGKYIRPLLLQGAAEHSDTWASLLRTYGYRTSAFYPPAIFFIDADRFTAFEQSHLGFEYQKREFLEGEARVQQLVRYLDEQTGAQPLFAWVHLFGPHEPYESHPEFGFGDRDIDRYDEEIAAADATLGRMVTEFRQRRPNAVVIVTADHGEEFGEHGGRYHGSSVYEEQVRVPLVISAPTAIEPGVVTAPVQTIDLLPTVLRAIGVPLRPRIRGRDLGAYLAGAKEPADGFAYAETDEHAMLAEGRLRLLCQRQLGACRLYDVVDDPLQRRDLASERADVVERMRARLRSLNASHGKFERQGLRAEGKGWPPAILRGIAGDGDAAPDIAALLDDADVTIRRKAAELLLQLARPETIASVRLALERDEDVEVMRYAALTLTRLGQGASLTVELLHDPEVRWRRWAALTLAENGDGRGEAELLAWWSHGERSHAESVDLLRALGTIRSKSAVGLLVRSLDDVRLRPLIAEQLARIGDPAARGALARALAIEPYQTARVALAGALEHLDADNELVVPLRRWLGVPDPLRGGLGIAVRSGILEHVGGPGSKDLAALRANAALGELVRVVVPKTGNGTGLRLIARAHNRGPTPQRLWVGLPHQMFAYDSAGQLKKARKVPEIHPERRVAIEFPPAASTQELFVRVPPELGLGPGRAEHLVVLAERQLELEAVAVLPLQDELAPVDEPSDEKPGIPPRHPGADPPKQ